MWRSLAKTMTAAEAVSYYENRLGQIDACSRHLAHILAGKVIADVRERHRVPVQIPDALLQRAREHYRVRSEALLARHPTASPSSATETG